MSEPLDVLILEALMNRLETPALTTPATPISYPLLSYTPTPGVKYVAVHPVMRADPFHPGLSFDGYTERRGTLQIDAVVPDNVGEPTGLRLAALIAARFPIGTDLVAGDYHLRLYKEPTTATAVKDAPWVRYPVSIPYLVIT